MSYHWNPTKKEMRDWLDRKIHEFIVQENRNLRIIKEQWLESYIYIDMHEIFFCSFSVELYEWIAKLANSQGRWRLDNPIFWTPKLVHRLEAIEDKITHAVDHWLDHIIGGLVTKFTVDTSVNYNDAERHFFKGLRGKYLKFLNTWIEMLFCKKQVMKLPWCSELHEVERLTRMKEERVLNIVHWFHLHWVTKRE